MAKLRWCRVSHSSPPLPSFLISSTLFVFLPLLFFTVTLSLPSPRHENQGSTLILLDIFLSRNFQLMATSSLLHLPELHFLSPQITLNRRFSPPSRSISILSTSNATLRTTRIHASKDESALAERVNNVEWSGNGVASRAGGIKGNGAAGGYANDVVKGRSVEYGYGNGVAATEVVEVEASKVNEDGRKRRLEEIGKEDAWFKQTEKEQVEVRCRFDCVSRLYKFEWSMNVWIIFFFCR